MKVKSQEIALVTNAAWNGDGVNSGILGLAFSGLTAVFDGANPNNDGSSNRSPYSPFFITAVSENVVSNPCKSS